MPLGQRGALGLLRSVAWVARCGGHSCLALCRAACCSLLWLPGGKDPAGVQWSRRGELLLLLPLLCRYYFLKDVYPRTGGRDVLKTPVWL